MNALLRRSPMTLAMLLVVGAPSFAQGAFRPAGDQAQHPALRQVESPLRTVDQGISDRSLLGHSLKQAGLGTELRRDTSWEHLYEVQTRSGGRRYFRYSNGLSASFTHSEFVLTEEDGEFNVTPAGTIYHIGRSVDEMAAEVAARDAAPAPPVSPLRISNRFDPAAAALAAPRMTTTFRPATDRATVMTDESYRQRRVQGLLRRVADEASDAAPAGSDLPSAPE